MAEQVDGGGNRRDACAECGWLRAHVGEVREGVSEGRGGWEEQDAYEETEWGSERVESEERLVTDFPRAAVERRSVPAFRCAGSAWRRRGSVAERWVKRKK